MSAPRDVIDPARRPWVADVETSAAEAARRIGARFPELAGRQVERFGEGWDNTAFLVDGTWVFRFPRRPIAVGLLETEVRALPWLWRRLPWPVPMPTFVAEGGPAGFEAGEGPFAGYGRLAGRPVAEADLDDATRSALAAPLGVFLRALHAAPIDEATGLGLPADPLGKADVAARAPRLAVRLADLAGRGVIDPEPLAAIVAEAEPVAEFVVVHGDLDARHVLVDDEGAPTGVIDWGDVHRGPRGTDLAAMWHVLPVAAHDAFRAAYGPISASDERLARFRALDVAAAVLMWGLDTGNEVALRAARTTLARLAFR